MTGEERLLASWSEKPYVSHRRRSTVVEHRLRLIVYSDGNVDVVHDIRAGRRNDREPEEWAEAEIYEVRGGRVRKTHRRDIP